MRREAGDSDPGLATTALTAGIVSIVLMTVGLMLLYGASDTVARQGQLAVVRGLADASNAGVELSKFGLVAFIGAVAVSAIRHGFLSRGFVALGVVAAGMALVSTVAMVAEDRTFEIGGPVDLIGPTPAGLWILCLSIVMLRRAQVGRTVSTATRTSRPARQAVP